ncbi:hypothetical protein GCM10007864_21430 [Sinorhizobium fredii]|nr:hypothetical protein GCM10007864_21430 [Sinorhizobium fredii]
MRPPCLPDAASFKHLMSAALLFEEIADPKPSRACAYDNGIVNPRHKFPSSQASDRIALFSARRGGLALSPE